MCRRVTRRCRRVERVGSEVHPKGAALSRWRKLLATRLRDTGGRYDRVVTYGQVCRSGRTSDAHGRAGRCVRCELPHVRLTGGHRLSTATSHATSETSRSAAPSQHCLCCAAVKHVAARRQFSIWELIGDMSACHWWQLTSHTFVIKLLPVLIGPSLVMMCTMIYMSNITHT